MDRYYKAAMANNAKTVVRITGDCPLVDPDLLDEMLAKFIEDESIDMLWNDGPPTYPDGLDIEIFSLKA